MQNCKIILKEDFLLGKYFKKLKLPLEYNSLDKLKANFRNSKATKGMLINGVMANLYTLSDSLEIQIGVKDKNGKLIKKNGSFQKDTITKLDIDFPEFPFEQFNQDYLQSLKDKDDESKIKAEWFASSSNTTDGNEVRKGAALNEQDFIKEAQVGNMVAVFFKDRDNIPKDLRKEVKNKNGTVFVMVPKKHLDKVTSLSKAIEYSEKINNAPVILSFEKEGEESTFVNRTYYKDNGETYTKKEVEEVRAKILDTDIVGLKKYYEKENVKIKELRSLEGDNFKIVKVKGKSKGVNPKINFKNVTFENYEISKDQLNYVFSTNKVIAQYNYVLNSTGRREDVSLFVPVLSISVQNYLKSNFRDENIIPLLEFLFGKSNGRFDFRNNHINRKEGETTSKHFITEGDIGKVLGSYPHIDTRLNGTGKVIDSLKLSLEEQAHFKEVFELMGFEENVSKKDFLYNYAVPKYVAFKFEDTNIRTFKRNNRYITLGNILDKDINSLNEFFNLIKEKTKDVTIIEDESVMDVNSLSLLKERNAFANLDTKTIFKRKDENFISPNGNKKASALEIEGILMEERLHILNDNWLETQIKEKTPIYKELKEELGLIESKGTKGLSKKLVNSIEGLFERTDKDTDASYEARVLSEFLTRGVTDPYLIEHFKSIKVKNTNLFQFLLSKIKKMFSFFFNEKEVDTLYEKLLTYNLASFNKVNKKPTGSKKKRKDKSNKKFSIKIKNTPQAPYQKKSQIDFYFSDYLYQVGVVPTELLEKTKGKYETFINTLNSFIEEGHEYFDGKHSNFLQNLTKEDIKYYQDNFDLISLEEEVTEDKDTEEEAIEEGNSTNSEGWTRQPNNKTVKDIANREIEYILRFLPRVTPTGDYQLSSKGTPILMNSNEAFSRVAQVIAGSNSDTEMFDRLFALKDNEGNTNVYVERLFDYLGIPVNSDNSDYDRDFNKPLVKKFWSSFNRVAVDLTNIIETDSGFRSFQETGTNTRGIKNDWNQSFMTDVMKVQFANTVKMDGEKGKNWYNYKTREFKESYFNGIVEALDIDTNDKNHKEGLPERRFAEAIAKYFGIVLSEETIKDIKPDVISTFARERKFIVKYLKDHNKTGDLTSFIDVMNSQGARLNGDLSTTDKGKLKTLSWNITQLINAESPNSLLRITQTVLDSQNKQRSRYSLPNAVSITLSFLEVFNRKGIKDKRLEKFTGTHKFQNTELYKYLFKEGGTAKLGLLTGFTKESEKVNDSTINLSDRAYLEQQYNLWKEKKTFEIMRNETASSAFHLVLDHNELGALTYFDHSNMESKLKELFKGYFRGEALTVRDHRAYEKETGKDFKKGTVKTRDWILFKHLEETHKELLDSVLDNLDKNIDEVWEEIYPTQRDFLTNNIYGKLKKQFEDNGLNKYTQVEVDGKNDLELFAYNYMVQQYETSLLFYGDAGYFADKKLFVRTKSHFSTGKHIPVDSWGETNDFQTSNEEDGFLKEEAKMVILNDEIGYNKEEDSAKIEQIKKDAFSSLTSKFKGVISQIKNKDSKKELEKTIERVSKNIDKSLNGYKDHEVSDGQSYVHLAYYKKMLDSLGLWTNEHEVLYKWEIKVWDNYKAGTLEQNKEALLASKPKGGFSQAKWIYSGPSGEKAEVIKDLQFIIKTSFKPLLPSMYLLDNREMSTTVATMYDSNIAIYTRPTALKAFQFKDSYETLRSQDKKPTDYKGLKVNDYNSVTNEVAKDVSIKIHLSYLREQIESNSKRKEKGIYGSQVKVLSFSDFVGSFKDGDSFKKIYTSPKWERLYTEYRKTIDSLMKIEKEELLTKWGINKKFKVEDKSKFRTALERAAKQKNASKTLIDFLELVKTKDIPYELSANQKTIKDIVTGAINKKLVRFELNGEPLIQFASTGTLELNSDNTTVDLDYYKYNEGKPTTKAGAKLAINKHWKKLFKNEKVIKVAEDMFEGVSKLKDEHYRRALNAIIQGKTDVTLDSKLYSIYGYRIPTSGPNLTDVFQIQEFLPESEGNMIIPPKEIVVKSGSDYDIDKMNFVFPEINSEGKYVTKQKFTDGDSLRINELKENLKENNTIITALSQQTNKELANVVYEEWNISKNLIPKINELRENGFKLYNKTITKEEYNIFRNSLDKEMSNERITLKNLLKELKDTKGEKSDVIKQLYSQNNETRKELNSLKDKKESEKKSLTNKILELNSEYLLSSENYYSLVTSVNNDFIAKAAKEDIKVNQEEILSESFGFHMSVKKRKDMMEGQKNLGVNAIATKLIQHYMRNGMTMKLEAKNGYKYFGNNLFRYLGGIPDQVYDKSINEIRLDSMFTLDGFLKSDLLNQLVQATVDAPKDPFLGEAGITKDTMPILTFLTGIIGLPFEKTINFFKEDVIKKDRQLLLAQGYSSKDAFIKQTENLVKEKMKLDALPEGITWVKKGNREFNYNLLYDYALQKNYKKLALLMEFQSYKKMADEHFKVQQLITFDSGVPTSSLEAYIRQRQYREYLSGMEVVYNKEKVKVDNVFNTDTITKIRKESEIASAEVSEMVKNSLESILPIAQKKEFIERVYGHYDGYKLFFKPKPIRESFLNKVQGSFIDYLVKNLKIDGVFFKDLFVARSKGMVQKWTNFKEDYPEFEGSTLDLFMTFNYFIKDEEIIEKVEMNSLAKFDDNANEITLLLEDIYDKDPEFAKDLAINGFGSTGLTKTYFSWYDMIPPKILTDLLEDSFKEYFSMVNKTPDIFKTQVNNYLEEFRKVNDNKGYYSKKPVKKNFEPAYLGKALDIYEYEELKDKVSKKETPIENKEEDYLLFEKDGKKVYMNQEQQVAFDTLVSRVTKALSNNEKLTEDSFFDNVEFTSPLTQSFSDKIPTQLYSRMFGLQGFGGTGKTTLAKALVKKLSKSKDKYNSTSVAFVAPTHIAATMLQESLGMDSENVGGVDTLAAYLRKDPVESEGSISGSQFKLRDFIGYKRSYKYKDPVGKVDIIIVDESSMLGTNDFKDFLIRLKQDKEAGVINKFPIFLFLGDYHQLPPISESNPNKLGIISSTVLKDPNKSVTLKKVMRSNDKNLADTYLTVANEIDKYLDAIESGRKYEMNPKEFISSLKTSYPNILKVNTNITSREALYGDYAEYLLNNSYPDGMFYIWYNREKNTKTLRERDNIRKTYLKKVYGENYKITNSVVEKDYVSYTKGVPSITPEVNLPLSLLKGNSELVDLLKESQINKDFFKVDSGVLKPKSRYKVISKIIDLKVTKKDLLNLDSSMPNEFKIFNFNKDFFLNSSFNSLVLYNRQKRLRGFLTFKDISFVKTEELRSRTNKIYGLKYILRNNNTKELLPIDVSFANKEKFEPVLQMLSNTPPVFNISYIGSSHSYQGAGINNVIADSENILSYLGKGLVHPLSTLASLYTSITRTKKKLIITTNSSEIDNSNWEGFYNDGIEKAAIDTDTVYEEVIKEPKIRTSLKLTGKEGNLFENLKSKIGEYYARKIYDINPDISLEEALKLVERLRKNYKVHRSENNDEGLFVLSPESTQQVVDGTKKYSIRRKDAAVKEEYVDRINQPGIYNISGNLYSIEYMGQGVYSEMVEMIGSNNFLEELGWGNGNTNEATLSFKEGNEEIRELYSITLLDQNVKNSAKIFEWNYEIEDMSNEEENLSRINFTKGDKEIGYVDFTITNKIEVSYVKSNFKREGNATKMYNKLKELYDLEIALPTKLTEEGKEFRKSFETFLSKLPKADC